MAAAVPADAEPRLELLQILVRIQRASEASCDVGALTRRPRAAVLAIRSHRRPGRGIGSVRVFHHQRVGVLVLGSENVLQNPGLHRVQANVHGLHFSLSAVGEEAREDRAKGGGHLVRTEIRVELEGSGEGPAVGRIHPRFPAEHAAPADRLLVEEALVFRHPLLAIEILKVREIRLGMLHTKRLKCGTGRQLTRIDVGLDAEPEGVTEDRRTPTPGHLLEQRLRRATEPLMREPDDEVHVEVRAAILCKRQKIRREGIVSRCRPHQIFRSFPLVFCSSHTSPQKASIPDFAEGTDREAFWSNAVALKLSPAPHTHSRRRGASGIPSLKRFLIQRSRPQAFTGTAYTFSPKGCFWHPLSQILLSRRGPGSVQ